MRPMGDQKQKIKKKYVYISKNHCLFVIIGGCCVRITTYIKRKTKLHKKDMDCKPSMDILFGIREDIGVAL